MQIKLEEPRDYLFVNPANISATSVGTGGMYYFYDKFGDVIYIGKTKSFRKRFAQHSRGSYFFTHVTKIKAFPIEREVDRDIYETYFINVYYPQYNVGKKWKEPAKVDQLSLIESYEEEIIELIDEIAELREVFEESDDELDNEWDFANDRDRLYAELGEQLYAADRLKQLRKRLRVAKSKRYSIINYGL